MTTELPPANLGKRGFAALIDYLAFYVLYVIAMTGTLPEPAPRAAGAAAALLLLVQAVLLTARGQSLGKLALGVRVVRADTGENGGFLKNVLLRVCVNSLLCATMVYFFADLYAAFWREDQRCLHDLIAGTRVVDA